MYSFCYRYLRCGSTIEALYVGIAKDTGRTRVAKIEEKSEQVVVQTV
jgi:hypothetical protein